MSAAGILESLPSLVELVNELHSEAIWCSLIPVDLQEVCDIFVLFLCVQSADHMPSIYFSDVLTNYFDVPL